jgi:hypothetical protein
MSKFAIVDQNYLTPKVKAGQVERNLPNGQAILRVNKNNEELLKDYIKYDADGIRNLDLNRKTKFICKHSVAVAESSLTPMVAIKKQEGDYSSIVSHNFCASGSPFEVKPDVDEKLYLTKSEVQFEHDLNLGANAISLNYYVWHPNFDDPIIGQTITFESIHNLFEIGNQHFTAPPIGDMQNSLTTLAFDQDTELVFHGNRKDFKLAKLEIVTETGEPLTGTYVTVSLITRTEAL